MRDTTTIRTAVLVLGLALVACDGMIGDPFGDEPSGGGAGVPDPGGSGGGGGGAGPGSVTPELCAGEPARVGATPVRRLNRSQYTHSIVDILGLDALPAAVGDRLIEIPDGRRGGFESSTEAASSEVLRSYLSAAEALADVVLAERLDRFASCDFAGAACARTLVERLGRLAFRRPLTDEEIERYVGLHTSVREMQDADAATHAVVTALFVSPSFLYLAEPVDEAAVTGEIVALDPYAFAARLSYFLWDSAPDEALLDAAEAGALADPDTRAAQIDRMLADPRASRVLERYHEQWLRLDELAQIDSDDPDLTVAMRDAMRRETLEFVERTVHEGEGTLSALLTASHTYASPELAAHYGAPPPDADGRVELDPDERAGLLTHASLLTGLGTVFPEVHRGLWVRNELLCDSPPPPPPDAPPAEASVRLATDPCVHCHKRMDLIGFGFADYDALGRHRAGAGGADLPTPEVFELEDGRLPPEVRGTFDGPRELAERLAGSRWVHDCVTVQWVRFATGREDSDADACGVLDVSDRFAETGGDVATLLEAIASSEGFRSRSVEELSP